MKKITIAIVFFLCCFSSLFANENNFLQDKDSTIYDKVWVLSRLNNRKVNYDEWQEKITLIITSENEYASGCSGCNTYVGQVLVKRNHIMFRDIGVTKMACPEGTLLLEMNYLNNLNDIDSWAIVDEDLYLYKNDRPVLIYSKQ